MGEPMLLTVAEVGQMLGVSRDVAYRLVRAGRYGDYERLPLVGRSRKVPRERVLADVRGEWDGMAS